LALPSGVHVFPSARYNEMVMTVTPNAAHAYAANFVRLYHGALRSVNLIKQHAGKMNARVVAETPPVISSMTPKSQVTSATNIEDNKIVDVKNTCRCMLNVSWEKKYCSMTSLHTNSSSGKVVNMFNPKQKRATLIRVSFGEKLFNIFPCVLSVKTTYPEIARVQHAASDSSVEMCVTIANRSSVGVRRLPYMRREL